MSRYTVSCPSPASEIRAIDWLAQHSELSRQNLKQAMEKGAVWLKQGKKSNRIRRATKLIKPDQFLTLYFDEKILSQQPYTAMLLADEKYYSVWYKPPGMLSQGTLYGDHASLLRIAEKSLNPQRPVFLINRLDKDAAGLMLIGHSTQAAAKINQLFQNQNIQKYYLAEVEGNFRPELPCVIDSPIDKKPATTIVERVNSSDETSSVLSIKILTGRKHQIRKHLASIGYPILGDKQYNQFAVPGHSLSLIAWKLEFRSPFDKQNKCYELNSTFPELDESVQQLLRYLANEQG